MPEMVIVCDTVNKFSKRLDPRKIKSLPLKWNVMAVDKNQAIRPSTGSIFKPTNNTH